MTVVVVAAVVAEGAAFHAASSRKFRRSAIC